MESGMNVIWCVAGSTESEHRPRSVLTSFVYSCCTTGSVFLDGKHISLQLNLITVLCCEDRGYSVDSCIVYVHSQNVSLHMNSNKCGEMVDI